MCTKVGLDYDIIYNKGKAIDVQCYKPGTNPTSRDNILESIE